VTASEVTDSRRDTAVATDPTRLYDVGKRATDVVLAAALLLPALPIFLIAAAAIRIESPGSPFFFQKRLGKNGKPFRLIKLRGMYRDARERFPHLYDYAAQKSLDFYFHHEEDPRVTRVGRFTRRTSIDELPNLLNVLKGDMSMVGPRPEIPEVLDLYGIYRSEYLSVKPGITCTSKCTGRDCLTKQQTVELDIQYVRTRGLRTDFKILWRTFCGVVLRRNVY
jgi:lipopolysaccharide/colanic/teichoic acid biosynthesis glycosyltransferase